MHDDSKDKDSNPLSLWFAKGCFIAFKVRHPIKNKSTVIAYNKHKYYQVLPRQSFQIMQEIPGWI